MGVWSDIYEIDVSNTGICQLKWLHIDYILSGTC